MKYLFPGGRAAVGFTGIVLGGIIFVELGGQFPWSKVDARRQPPTDRKQSLRQPTSLVYQRLHRQEMCRRQDGSLSSEAYCNMQSDPFPGGKS
ncbi:hypothetical protein BS47DRAFT_1389754 [Hydnum rufescens UP504]|uniref:Uncharacterized protein n=1 Tax=Hydnum rufescens UP504 TaxID=1448309 RepID=A0A9P6DZY6_9AGAM|nr:hypothetical protein BS47DRAFT_1389754 [Hydnum rufescens UP504]